MYQRSVMPAVDVRQCMSNMINMPRLAASCTRWSKMIPEGRDCDHSSFQEQISALIADEYYPCAGRTGKEWYSSTGILLVVTSDR